MAAGASNVVGTLWPVDDIATCYLMVEFYRRLFERDDVDVPQALYDTQRWLREMGELDEQEFLARNPYLRQALESEGVGLACESAADLPFADAEFWAPFATFR